MNPSVSNPPLSGRIQIETNIHALLQQPKYQEACFPSVWLVLAPDPLFGLLCQGLTQTPYYYPYVSPSKPASGSAMRRLDKKKCKKSAGRDLSGSRESRWAAVGPKRSLTASNRPESHNKTS